MSDAGVHLAGRDLVEGVLHLLDGIELLVVRQPVESLALVDALHLTEDGLDGVVVGAVAQVEDRNDLQPPVGVHRFFALMHPKVIHEDHQVLVVVDEGDPVEELDVLVAVEGLLLDGEGLDAGAFGDHRADGHVAAVDSLLVDVDVGVLVAPLNLLDARLGEVDLIEPKDAPAQTLLELELRDDLQPLLLSLLLITKFPKFPSEIAEGN